MSKTGIKPSYKYQDTKIAALLRKRIDELASEKNQREIAAEIGYDNGNILSMYKRGEAKIPLDKIPAMSDALKIDPALMFRLALEQWWEGKERTIAKIFGSVTSQNQRDWLGVISETMNEEDPVLTDERRQALVAALTKA